MKQKFLFHYVKELSKLRYKFFCTFALQRFVDEIISFNSLLCPLIPSHFASPVDVEYQSFINKHEQTINFRSRVFIGKQLYNLLSDASLCKV